MRHSSRSGAVGDRALDGGDAIGVGRLPQHVEQSFGFAHRGRSKLSARANAALRR